MEIKKDFFNGLGQALSRTAKDLSDHASNVYESQKIRSKINAEERAISKLKSDIGNLILARYQDGEQFEGELGRLLGEIIAHQEKIRTLEDDNANLKGKKICPSCRKEVPVDAQFCPACGAVCPVPEATDEIMDAENIQVLDDIEEAAAEAEGAVKEALEEAADAAADTAEEISEAVDASFETVKDDMFEE